MADTSRFIFKGTIEGRPVEIEIYDEGSYRVHTTQGADDPGSIQSDDSSTVIIPATEQGRKITIEGGAPEEIRKDLLSEGFSNAAANEIVSKLPV
ncbi:MAG: hypothetical protein Q8L74_10940 [Nitrospirota bacterium]|nr:hypothetical protein [Nitrospirota bacterium]MDP2383669.1 hypothetical protein [Nitrospirota bacterium]MDP3598023.1 hypothetical protein [Nitrospirota bacterium]